MSKAKIMALFKVEQFNPEQAKTFLSEAWNVEVSNLPRYIHSMPEMLHINQPTRFSEKELPSYFTHCRTDEPLVTRYFAYEQINLKANQLEFTLQNSRTQEITSAQLSDRVQVYDIADFDKNGLLDIAVITRDGALTVFYTQDDEAACKAEQDAR